MTTFSSKNRFVPPAQWSLSMLLANPIFTELCQRFPFSQQRDWPLPTELNGWRTHDRFSFVDNALLEQDGRYYEAYIAANKQIPTRAENWHDFFGALIWCLFPKTKALLNQLHMQDIQLYGHKHRTLLRNKLTLFDECGVIVCVEPAMSAHKNWLRGHEWQQSFYKQRVDWWHEIKPVIFGHAMYEMATAPFIGLTGKALFVDVPKGFCQWSLTDAYTFLDENLVQQIDNNQLLLDNEQLTPLPLLGIPQWYAANQRQDFYLNTDYFRPHKSR